jgi:ribosome-associated protein
MTLGQFLKVAGMAATGGEAKYLISTGQVTVNGRVETKRGHHLSAGDTVSMEGQDPPRLLVESADRQ